MTKSSTHSTSTAPSSESGQRAHSGVTTFENRSVKVIRSVTIQRPASELYAFFKNPENLGKILRQPSSVSREDDSTSAWTIALPDNQRILSRVQIINEHPGELLAWSSLHDSDISWAGTLRFEKAIGGQGTEVIAQIEYDPPRGNLSSIFESISGEDVGRQLGAALARARDVIESPGAGSAGMQAQNPS